MTTHINNNLGGSGNLGWGLGDDAYHHTNARPAALPAATQQTVSTPQEQLSRLQALLTLESQGRGMTLSALSRFYSDTIAVYQNDSGSDTSFARTSAQSQQNLAEIQQLLRALSRNAEYRNRLQPLLDEFDRIQGYLELEETLRSGTSFLGRDTFEKLGVFINMGASLAGRAGSIAGMILGFRGNASLAMASGLANAWFQNGLHLTHAYGQGRNFTNREIIGELGDSALSAMACSLLNVGLGSIRGSSKWWSFGLFTADVMCEFVISEASPVKRLLGLETRGLRHGWKAYAYGVVANALGEILGDGAGHMMQRAGRQSRGAPACAPANFGRTHGADPTGEGEGINNLHPLPNPPPSRGRGEDLSTSLPVHQFTTSPSNDNAIPLREAPVQLIPMAMAVGAECYSQPQWIESLPANDNQLVPQFFASVSSTQTGYVLDSSFTFTRADLDRIAQVSQTLRSSPVSNRIELFIQLENLLDGELPRDIPTLKKLEEVLMFLEASQYNKQELQDQIKPLLKAVQVALKELKIKCADKTKKVIPLQIVSPNVIDQQKKLTKYINILKSSLHARYKLISSTSQEKFTEEIVERFQTKVCAAVELQNQLPPLMEMFSAWHDLFVLSLYIKSQLKENVQSETYDKLHQCIFNAFTQLMSTCTQTSNINHNWFCLLAIRAFKLKFSNSSPCAEHIDPLLNFYLSAMNDSEGFNNARYGQDLKKWVERYSSSQFSNASLAQSVVKKYWMIGAMLFGLGALSAFNPKAALNVLSLALAPLAMVVGEDKKGKLLNEREYRLASNGSAVSLRVPLEVSGIPTDIIQPYIVRSEEGLCFQLPCEDISVIQCVKNMIEEGSLDIASAQKFQEKLWYKNDADQWQFLEEGASLPIFEGLVFSWGQAQYKVLSIEGSQLRTQLLTNDKETKRIHKISSKFIDEYFLPADFVRIGREIQLPEIPQTIIDKHQEQNFQVHEKHLPHVSYFSAQNISRSKFNEDRAEIVMLPDGSELILVIDGVGGAYEAHTAAIRCKLIIRWAMTHGASLDEAVELAHRDLWTQGLQLPEDNTYQCALTAAHITKNEHGNKQARILTVGDTEFAVLDPDKNKVITWNTRDPLFQNNNYPQAQLDEEGYAKSLDEVRVARFDPMSNSMDGSVGSYFNPRIRNIVLELNQVLMLSTDGAYEAIAYEEVLANLIATRENESFEQRAREVFAEILFRQALAERAIELAKDEKYWPAFTLIKRSRTRAESIQLAIQDALMVAMFRYMQFPSNFKFNYERTGTSFVLGLFEKTYEAFIIWGKYHKLPNQIRSLYFLINGNETYPENAADLIRRIRPSRIKIYDDTTLVLYRA